MIGVIILPFLLIYNFFLSSITLKWIGLFQDKLKNKIFKIIVISIHLLFPLALLVGLFLKSGNIRRTLLFLGNCWLAMAIYSMMILIIALILKIVFHKIIIKHDYKKIYKIAGSICFILLVFVVGYGFMNARIINTDTYNVTIKKESKLDNLNITFASDLHIGYSIGNDHINKMVNKINATKPDIVFLVGDIFDNEYQAIEDADELIKILKNIKSKYGVYAVYGNHDIEEKTFMGFTFSSKKEKVSAEGMDEILNKSNIKLLKDEYVLINDSFYVFGRADYTRLNRGIKKRKTPEEITQNLDKNLPIIVLDHQPRQLDELASAGIDLDLSGHTHNGQLFPLNYLVRLYYKNTYGIKKIDDMYSIVSAGVGVYGPYIRLMADADISNVKVTFKK